MIFWPVRTVALTFILAAAAEANAQELKIVTLPAIGVETTVPAGGDLYSLVQIYT